jgi:RNA recognition motif-containing protein
MSTPGPVENLFKSAPPRPFRWPVVITNLPRNLCWQELKDFSRTAGGLCAFCDIDRSTRGRGFIEYVCRQDAENAIRRLDGAKLGGKTVHLSFPEGICTPPSQELFPHDPTQYSPGYRRMGASRDRARSASPNRRSRHPPQKQDRTLSPPFRSSKAAFPRDYETWDPVACYGPTYRGRYSPSAFEAYMRSRHEHQLRREREERESCYGQNFVGFPLL